MHKETQEWLEGEIANYDFSPQEKHEVYKAMETHKSVRCEYSAMGQYVAHFEDYDGPGDHTGSGPSAADAKTSLFETAFC